MSKLEIERFIALHSSTLVGSAIFTKNKSAISKLICWTSRGRRPRSFFVPSHVGSIIEFEGQLYIFDMKPPRGSLTLLKDYLVTTEDDYVLVVRDFYSFSKTWFSDFLLKRVGQDYGYGSAFCSAFRLFARAPLNPDDEQKKGREHCSELHIKALQEQGLFLGYEANSMMPIDVMDVLVKKAVLV